jgi:hypothetical protein
LVENLVSSRFLSELKRYKTQNKKFGLFFKDVILGFSLIEEKHRLRMCENKFLKYILKAEVTTKSREKYIIRSFTVQNLNKMKEDYVDEACNKLGCDDTIIHHFRWKIWREEGALET